MFNEDQEVFCIIAILVFWCLCLFSPLFIIFAVIFALYMCLDTDDDEWEDDDDDEGPVSLTK